MEKTRNHHLKNVKLHRVNGVIDANASCMLTESEPGRCKRVTDFVKQYGRFGVPHFSSFVVLVESGSSWKPSPTYDHVANGIEFHEMSPREVENPHAALRVKVVMPSMGGSAKSLPPSSKNISIWRESHPV
ncbi:hypothetical protein ACLB2K_037915 [Fragaria x ananassa]